MNNERYYIYTKLSPNIVQICECKYVNNLYSKIIYLAQEDIPGSIIKECSKRIPSDYSG